MTSIDVFDNCVRPESMRMEPFLGDYLPVIGIFAEDRAGKDTAASYLVEKYGFYRIAFADRMKDAYHDLNPRIAVPYKGTMKLQEAFKTYTEDWIKEHCPDYREGLVNFGTKVLRRNLGMERIWVDHLINHIDNMPKWVNHPEGVVIPDVRDQLEGHAVTQELGGYVIELRSQRGEGHYGTKEDVATLKDLASYVIVNDGSKEDLHGQLDLMVATIMRDYDMEEE